jgi:excisionase family DNA binding protein
MRQPENEEQARTIAVTRSPTTQRFDQLPLLLTVAETAALLRTTARAIYARAERGLLPGVIRDGRRVLIDRDDLLRYLGEKQSRAATDVLRVASTKRRASSPGRQLSRRPRELPCPPDETATASPRR